MTVLLGMMVLLIDLDLVFSFSYVQMVIYNHTVLLIDLLRSEVRRVMYNSEYGILTVCCGRHKYQVNLQMTETIREVINEGKLTAMWT